MPIVKAPKLTKNQSQKGVLTLGKGKGVPVEKPLRSKSCLKFVRYSRATSIGSPFRWMGKRM